MYHINKTIVPAHFDIKPHDIFYLTYLEKIHKVKEDKNFIYVMNNYGHRSEDFKKEHDGLHILFSGCSITFGDSLPYKTNWSGRLYDMLSKQYRLSNYFNLSYMGASTEFIIFNIFQYCKSFGNPDVLFMYLPDSGRKMFWDESKKEYKNHAGENPTEPDKRMSWLRSYQYVVMLEQYCKTNSIKLLWSCWNGDDLSFYKNHNFENLIVFDEVKIFKKSNNYDESKSIYYDYGRDKIHPGLWYSSGLSNIFYEEFFERYQNEKDLQNFAFKIKN